MKRQIRDRFAIPIDANRFLQKVAKFFLMPLLCSILLFSIQVKVSIYHPASSTEATTAMKFASGEKSGLIAKLKFKEFGEDLPVFTLILLASKTARAWALDRERAEQSIYSGFLTQKHYLFLDHRPPPSLVCAVSINVTGRY